MFWYGLILLSTELFCPKYQATAYNFKRTCALTSAITERSKWREKVSNAIPCFGHCCLVIFEQGNLNLLHVRFYKGATKCEWELCECEAGWKGACMPSKALLGIKKSSKIIWHKIQCIKLSYNSALSFFFPFLGETWHNSLYKWSEKYRGRSS